MDTKNNNSIGLYQENQQTGNIAQTNIKHSLEDFAKLLFKAEEGKIFDFEFEEGEGPFWGAVHITLFNSKLIVFSYYGGGDSFMHDISQDEDHKVLLDVMKTFLKDFTNDHIFLEESEDSINITTSNKTIKSNKAINYLNEAPTFNEQGGYGIYYVKNAIQIAETEISEVANSKIDDLISQIIEVDREALKNVCPPNHSFVKNRCEKLTCEKCKESYLSRQARILKKEYKI